MTIRLAISVAFSISLDAPVVGSLNTSSSATLPPINIANRSFNSAFDERYFSLSGKACVYPKALPLGMIVTLCMGSAFGSAQPTNACPVS